MAEFFIEILSEEIPARLQLQAMEDCREKFHALLAPYFPTLLLDSFKSFVTPRRLGIAVTDLPLQTASRQEERRGPKETAPDAAFQGFLKSVGLPKDQCILKNGHWFATIETAPESLALVLPQLVSLFFKTFPWPKTMRWPSSSIPWIRPIRSVLCILGGEPLLFDLPELGIRTTSTTKGHRFLANHEITVTSFEDYQQKLAEAFVSIDPFERQRQIHDQLAFDATQKGLHVEEDLALERETAGLVEYPVCLLGKIDPVFLRLPKEVLATSLRHHQKSFILLDADNKVAPFFGLVANCPPRSPEMLEGYERVLKARLSDARFFFEQDLKTPLKDLGSKLDSIVFHQRLGSLADKVQRLQTLVSTPEGQMAASLSKSDLLTTMVGEFPELQGVMGRIYALEQGYSVEIADALQEYYKPQGPLDACPTQSLSVELALADKIDRLVGFFAIGELPTGSKDPYALRRAALGVIRLLRENDLHDDDLLSLIHQGAAAYQEQGLIQLPASLSELLREFFLERLKVLLRQEGIRFDCVDAVTNSKDRSLNIWSIAERAKALQDFLATPEGEALKAAFTRANGILGETDGALDFAEEDSTSWEQEELVLLKHLKALEKTSPKLLEEHRYKELMQELALLRPVIDSFFSLKINDEDPKLRERRHHLLRVFVRKTQACADFSKIEG